MTAKRPPGPSASVLSGQVPDKKLEAKFYRTQAGNVPVLDWIKGLSGDDRKRIGESIRTVELTWPVPPPRVKKLTDHLWEIRETIGNLNEARIIFIVDSGFCVLLHGFEKKARKTPRQELDTADGRRRDYNRQKEIAAMKAKAKKALDPERLRLLSVAYGLLPIGTEHVRTDLS